MSIEPYTSNSIEQELANGAEMSIELDSQSSDLLEVFVDDGSGGSPDGYDLRVEFFSTEARDWFLVQDLTSQGNQAPDLAKDVKQSVTAKRVRLTLVANSATTYRLVGETFRVR